MNKLEELLARCKCGVFVMINEHRDYYQTAEEKLAELACYECPPEIAEDVQAKMVALDTVVEIQFYPLTPVGFYRVYHHDINEALKEALECLDGE